MSDKQETPKIKYFEKFLSNVSHIDVKDTADPAVVKELIAAVNKFKS